MDKTTQHYKCNDKSMDLEIVICTHNRSLLLARTLEFLNSAKRPEGSKVGIFVIANACDDDTIKLLSSYRDCDLDQGNYTLPLRFVEERKVGKSYALNTALNMLMAPVIAFVDDDHRIDSEYLVQICSAVRRYSDATIYCGRILPDWDGDEPQWAHDIGEYAIYPLPIPRYDQGLVPKIIGREGPLPGGGNLVVKSEVFARTGKFSTSLGPHGHDLGGGEDSDYVSRALDGGETVQYVPEIVQHHYVEVDRFRLRYLMLKSFQRSQSVTRVKLPVKSWPPKYLWRKLSGYLWKTIISLYWPEKRFYLVRTAATLGEISAYLAVNKSND